MHARIRNPILALITFLVALLAFGWAADYAEAADTTIEFTGSDFYIPRPADRSDQVGVERLLTSVDVPAELVGLACSVVGTSTNGESVHPNNYGMLRSNGDSVRIDGTEDAANGVKLSDRTIVLGTTVQLFNVMLGDPVATSVDYTVRVTCTPATDDTTTTTAPPTSSSSTTPSTTTSSSTTTTLPSTTSTSIPPATTTTVPTESTTTTAPPNTSTTQPDGSTSTTAPTGSTSSSIIEQDTSTTTQPTTDETLPHTGPPVEVAGIAMAGVALLLLGGAIVLGTRA
jgi:hypothetical protein